MNVKDPLRLELKKMPQDLSYDDWVRYCFDREVKKPEWYWQYDENGDADWYCPTPSLLASYLCRLFKRSGDLLDQYSQEQVAQGLYFICSSGSGYLQTAREGSVSKEDQINWIKSVSHLYTDLFSKACSHYYGHLDQGPEKPKPLNSLCYMFWDLDCLEGAAMFPGEEYLVEPIFEVLCCALKQPSPACIESALHGLGHLEIYHPDRVHKLIGDFLGSHADATAELTAYAERALKGCVL